MSTKYFCSLFLVGEHYKVHRTGNFKTCCLSSGVQSTRFFFRFFIECNSGNMTLKSTLIESSRPITIIHFPEAQICTAVAYYTATLGRFRIGILRPVQKLVGLYRSLCPVEGGLCPPFVWIVTSTKISIGLRVVNERR